MELYGFNWILWDFKETSRTLMGYQGVLMQLYECYGIVRDFYITLWVLMGLYGILMKLHEFQWDFIGFL